MSQAISFSGVDDRRELLLRGLKQCEPVILNRYRFRLGHLSRRFDEADIFQVVATNVVRGFGSFRGNSDEAIQHWIFTIARRVNVLSANPRFRVG